LSWSIPYTAGVLALGWQIKPDYSSQQMRELLIVSAYPCRAGGRIINPRRFIDLVRNPLRAEKEINKLKGTVTGTTQNPVGFWKSVDFVSRIEDFYPGHKTWAGRLRLQSIVFRTDGTTSSFVRWKDGKIIHESGKVKADYVIKEWTGKFICSFPGCQAMWSNAGCSQNTTYCRKSTRRTTTEAYPVSGGQTSKITVFFKKS
jgi:hypothetical protein